MYGIGQAELLVLIVIAFMTFVPGILALGVLIWFIARKRSTSASPGVGPLISCNDCGGKVSRQAKACPHCGRPVFGGEPEVDR